MRFLFVSTHFPQNPYSSVIGVYKRMALFIDALKTIGSLDMLFYVPEPVDTGAKSLSGFEKTLSEYWKADIKLFLAKRFDHPKNISNFKRYITPVFNFFRQTKYVRTSMPDQLTAFRDCLKNRPAAIFVHRLDSICPLLLSNEKLPPVFFDMDDIEHVASIRNIKQPPKWFLKRMLYLQIPALRWGERRAMRLADQTFVCSNVDRNYLERLWNIKKITAIPNSVSMPDHRPIPDTQNLLFLGSYNYEPNRNAAEFLLDKVWPLIHNEIPDARLIFAGADPEKIRHFGSNPSGVEFTGFVEDIEALYSNTRIALCPILSGGGTRVKIAEAASFGKPTVTTAIGVEGIGMRDGEEILIRDSPESFAKACSKLLKDKALCVYMGNAARNYAEKNLHKKKAIEKIRKNIIPNLNHLP